MAADIISTGKAVKQTTAADPPPGPRLNPYTDPGPWRAMDIGGVRVPGVIQAIDGCEKVDDWNVQKATSSSGATTVWKGQKLAESITITIALHNAQAFADYYVLRDALRPKPGTKPPSLILTNPIVNFNGITRVACLDVGAPRWNASGGYWTGVIKVIEYNPAKPTNAGPAGAAKPKSSAPDPNQDVKNELQRTLDEAARA